MITIIIGSLIGVVIVIIFSFYNEWDDLVGTIGSAIMAGIICGFIGFFVALSLNADMETKTYEMQIENLQDNTSVSGRFFLGSGHIDGRMSYMFYYKTGDYYKLKILDYKEAKIKYTQGSPKAIGSYIVAKDNVWNMFAIDFSSNTEYVIEVPEGTIKNNYNLDAQ